MAPRFSIVVPCYQAERTLLGALNSLQRQDFKDWEAVLVDDGSTDGTKAIIESAQKDDSRIRYIFNSTNRGPGPPKNCGLDHVTGEYVLFLDADDEIVEKSLAELDSEIGGTSPDVVLFGVRELRGSRERNLHDESLLGAVTSESKTMNPVELPGFLMWPPASWSRAYRVRFLQEHGLRFPDGIYEDIPWTIETSLRANSFMVAKAIVYRYITREAGSSITTTQNHMSLDRVTQVHRARKIALSHELRSDALRALSALAAVHLIWANLAAYRTVPVHLREDFFIESSRELNFWPAVGILDARVRSEPLMGTRERVKLARALLSGNYSNWQKALSRRTSVRRWTRRLSPRRYLRYWKRPLL